MKIAVIDMGTNTFHLLVAEKSGNGFQMVRNEKLPVKLGKGGINKGLITQDAYARAIDTMINFRIQLDEMEVDKIIAVATSAVRNAANGDQLIKSIYEKTGIDVKVISGEEEALYIWEGVKQAVDVQNVSMAMDIGGGSVEFIIGDKANIFWKQSVEIGGQRLVELFHKTDPMSADDIRELNKYLEEQLSPLIEVIKGFSPKELIGCSGTFDTLAEIDSKEKDKPVNTDYIKEYSLSLDTFNHLYQLIVSRNREERMRIPGMISLRVDMIVVAMCLVKFIIESGGFTSIRVSTYALKEGIMAETINSKL